MVLNCGLTGLGTVLTPNGTSTGKEGLRLPQDVRLRIAKPYLELSESGSPMVLKRDLFDDGPGDSFGSFYESGTYGKALFTVLTPVIVFCNCRNSLSF